MTIKILKYLIILILIIPEYFSAQTGFINRFYGKSSAQKFLIKQWTSDNGLPQNSVNDIVQTKDGYLWLATFDGLVRFDGSQFKIIRQSDNNIFKSNRITVLAVSEDGVLWIGNENGQIISFCNNTFKDYSNIIKTNNHSIFFIKAKDSINFSVITSKDFISYKNGKVDIYHHKELFNEAHILNVIKKSKTELQILSNVGSFTVYKNSSQIIQDEKPVKINMIEGYRSTSNKKWFDDLIKLGFRGKFLFFKKANESKRIINVNNIFIDSHNRIWIATHEGLNLESPKGTFTFNSENMNDDINKIFEDNKGNIWVGAATKGLIQLSTRHIFNIPLKNKTFNNILYPVIQRKNGEIWSGSNGGGLVRINNNSIKYFSTKDGLINTSIWSLLEDKNERLWVGSYGGGLSYLNGNRFRKFVMWDSLRSKSIFALFEDSKGGLWIGSSGGAAYYYNNNLLYFTKKQGLPSNKIRAVAEAENGIIWFATDNGLAYVKNDKIYNVLLPKKYDSYSVRSLYIDKTGRLWAGTYGQGLLTYHRGQVKLIGKDNGLFDNVVSTILEDDYGNFWMTCNHGLFKVAYNNLISFIEGGKNEIYTAVYQKDDGFLSNEFNGGQMPSSCKLDDGTLLFPSFGGLVAVDPLLGKSSNDYHQIYLNKTIINNREFTSGKDITIPAGDNNVAFYFSVIEFNKPDQIFLRYKINNLQNKWAPLPDSRTLSFVNIDPGDYQLIIEEKNITGDWLPTNVIENFHVESRFYETTLFFIVLFAFILTVIFAIGRYWILSVKKKNRLLEKLVRERTHNIEVEKANTQKALIEVSNEKLKVDKANIAKTELMRTVVHDLKNPISAIRGSVDLIQSGGLDMASLDELAGIIKKATDESLEMIMQFLNQSELEDPRFLLNISKTNMIDLICKIVNKNSFFAEKKEQILKFSHTGNEICNLNIDSAKIDSALTNLISNAIKYSQIKTEIKVLFEELKSSVKISVIDNGPGLTSEDHKIVFGKFCKLSARPTGDETSTGLGLSIVKRIIELHGGQVGVESTFGNGSEFYILLPKEN